MRAHERLAQRLVRAIRALLLDEAASRSASDESRRVQMNASQCVSRLQVSSRDDASLRSTYPTTDGAFA